MLSSPLWGIGDAFSSHYSFASWEEENTTDEERQNPIPRNDDDETEQ
jgi:hypothetical protein